MKTGKNYRAIVLLLILPVVILATGILYVHITGLYFLRSVDPEYAYLFNGLILAQLHPNIQYTDHPGVPVLCMVAFVMHGVHLFRPGLSLVSDVMQNPELYIRALLYTANFVNAGAVFLLGYFTYRYSRNLVIAAFLQLTPFTHILTLEVLGRMMPELIMTGIVCGWLIVLVKLIYQEHSERNYYRYSLVFAMLFGLSIADKLTFLPYILLPLIVLPSWNFRLRFIVLSLFSFLLFGFPVILNLNNFFRWVTNIFTHTGAYGGGERGILKWNEFCYHVKLLVGNTHLLLFSIIVLIVIAVFYVIKQRKYKHITDVNKRIILALIAVFAMQYFMTAKYYASHYMVPALLLTTFSIFMISVLLIRLFPAQLKVKIMNMLLGITGTLLFLSMAPKIAGQLKQIQQSSAVKAQAYNQLSPLLKGSPKIICPSYYGCSAVEYALTFGLHASGRHAGLLFENMRELYPSTYMYFPWGKVFYEGNKEILPSSFLQHSVAYKLYIADYSEEKLNEILAALQPPDGSYDLDVRNLYYSPATAESLYLLKIANIDNANSLMKSCN